MSFDEYVATQQMQGGDNTSNGEFNEQNTSTDTGDSTASSAKANQTYLPKTYEEGKEYAKLKGMHDALVDDEVKQANKAKNIEVLAEELELERQKVELKKLQIEKDKLEVESVKTKVASDNFRTVYGSKLDKQEFNYRSLAPILNSIYITKPMSVFVMWFLSLIGLFVFIPKCFIRGTVGSFIEWIARLISGKVEQPQKYANRLDKEGQK